MGPVSAEITVDAARQQAFDVVADLANRPAFTDHFMSEFRLARIESEGVGASARFQFMDGPKMWFDTNITALESPHRISESGRGGRLNRIPARIEWEFIEGPGAMTTIRVTHWTEPSGRFDGGREMMSGATRFYSKGWKTALHRLRDLLEGDGGPIEGRVAVAGGNRHPTGVP